MRASLDSLLDAPATAQVRLMQSGVVKPSEILEGYIARVHQNDPYLNAVVDQDYEGARRSARELERLPLADRQSLPLYGLCASIKEFIATRGLSWTAGLAWRREMKAQSGCRRCPANPRGRCHTIHSLEWPGGWALA